MTQERKLNREWILKLKGVLGKHLMLLKQLSGKEKRKLQIGSTSRSRKMVKLIRETQTGLRTIFSKYLSALNRIIALRARKVRVKRLRLKKYFQSDRAMAYTGAEDEELEDGWVIEESSRLDLKQHVDMIFDNMHTDLLAVIKASQYEAYMMAVQEIDKTPAGELHDYSLAESDEQALKKEGDDEDEYLVAFLSKMRQQYKDVIDGNVEYTGNGYVFDSPAEVGDVLRGIGESAASRLDLHGMAAPESSMIAGLVASGLAAGYLGGVWHTLHDNVVCPDCRSMDGHWMTMEQFKANYKNTLCDGSCRCGEQFEHTNDVSRALYGVWAEGI
jgi:hypothetical protein